MPVKASASSVSRQHNGVNPNRELTHSRARCAARLRAITDVRLSMGARSLYVLLDDYAGRKGVGWPKQQTLAHRLGASRQNIQRWVAELERHGWIVIERTGRANRYTLSWAIRASDSTPSGHRISICKPVVIPQPEPEAAVLAEIPPTEPGPCRCGDSGWFWHDGIRSGTRYRHPVVCGCKPIDLQTVYRLAGRV